jgi:hypothetical protein
MDYTPLRRRLHDLISGLKDLATHNRLADLCEQLGLPSPGTEGSKRDRLYASIDAAPDADLAGIAKFYLSGFARDATTPMRSRNLSGRFPHRRKYRCDFAARSHGLSKESRFISSRTRSWTCSKVSSSYRTLSISLRRLRTTSNGRSTSGLSKTTIGARMTSSTISAPTLARTNDSCFCWRASLHRW